MVDNNSVYSESPLADIVALRGSCRKGRWDVPEGQNGITNVKDILKAHIDINFLGAK